MSYHNERRQTPIMISSQTGEIIRNAVYYPVELNIISDVSIDLFHTADGLGQPWYKLPKKAFEEIILTCLKVNYVLNHRDNLLYHNKEVPDMYIINLLQRSIMVPRFIRDILREILRPMHHAGISYLPDIDLTFVQTPHLLDVFYPISEHLTRWSNICQKLGFEMVPILPESVQSVSLTFYSYETDEILSFDNITNLDWRIESFGRTKHLVHNPSLEVEDTDKPLPAASRKKAREQESEIRQERRMYERPIQDRRILGMLVYRYTCAPYSSRLGYICPDYRFPTEFEHSRTPPRSNRVESSDQMLVSARDKDFKKKKKPRVVTKE